MHFLIGQRRTGKTTASLNWLRADPNRVLLVHDAAEAYRLAAYLPPSMKHRVHYVNGNMWAHGLPMETELGVENIDLLLNRLLGLHFPITFVTATGTVKEMKVPKSKGKPFWRLKQRKLI